MANHHNELCRKLYHFYKEHGICPRCGQAKPKPGYVECETCLMKLRQARKRADPDGSQHREREKRRYEHHKANGLCACCGKQAVEGKVYCKSCARKRNEKDQVSRIKQRIRRQANG